MEAPIVWLLEGAPYIRYRARRDLLALPENDPLVATDRQAMLADPLIQDIITELREWPGPVIASHKSAKQHFHKLTFLAEIGLRADDPGMGPIIERIFGLRSPEGPFALHMNIGAAYGGTGTEALAWALCDTPLITYALVKLGLGEDGHVVAAGDYLMRLGRVAPEAGPAWRPSTPFHSAQDATQAPPPASPQGWPCAVSGSLGDWRGPGKKDDPCPFANLAMLKIAAQHPGWRDTQETRAGAETLLSLWADSRTRQPYIFYMGDDFRKLKAPFIWYDLLHVLDVLTQFPWLKGDDRLDDMLSVLRSKADAEGRFTAESVYQPWAGWEFAQKKAPSRWVTLLAHRILGRLN